MKIEVGGQTYTINFEDFKAQQEFYRQKEKELLDWIFSGQRTIDLFGVEGAKRVLARQGREDARNLYKHKKRGKK